MGKVALGAGVVVAVGEGSSVGVAVLVGVGSGVKVARSGGVSIKLSDAGAACDGAPQALNPISAAQHIASHVFQYIFHICEIILHFARIFRL